MIEGDLLLSLALYAYVIHFNKKLATVMLQQYLNGNWGVLRVYCFIPALICILLKQYQNTNTTK